MDHDYFFIFFSFILPNHSYNTDFNGETLLKSFLLIPNENLNGYGNFPFLYVGWTLTYEMFFYIVLSISLVLSKKKAMIIAASILFCIAFFLVNYPILGHSNYLLLEFVSGLVIGHFYMKFKKTKYYELLFNHYVMVLTCVLLIFGGLGLVYVLSYKFETKLINACIIIIVFLIIEEFVKDKTAFKKLSFLGDISYSTYLIHPIILGWFQIIFSSIDSGIIRFFIIIMCIYLTYIFSKLTYRHIELNKWIFKTKENLREFLISGLNIIKLRDFF